MNVRKPFAVFVTVALSLQTAHACGPEFPTGYVWRDTGKRILDMPQANFFVELSRILDNADRLSSDTADCRITPNAVYEKADASWLRTLNADSADLKNALETSPMDAEMAATVLDQYHDLRKAMKLFADAVVDNTESDPVKTDDTQELAAQIAFDFAPHEDLMDQLPAEFALYVRGAAAYRLKDYDTAIILWSQLLDMPADERQYRSTWAAFMLGKSWMRSDPDRAFGYFELTRYLVGQHFRDSLDLTGSSLGWQAHAEYKSGNWTAAMRRYAAIFQSGSETCRREARASLSMICWRVFRGKDIPQDLVKDPLCCRILTAWLISGGGLAEDVQKWAAAVNAAGSDVDVQGAGRLAWAAYSAGDMELADRWTVIAGPDCPYAQWVRAKLLFRDGKMDEGFALLHDVKNTFPADYLWREPNTSYQTIAPYQVVHGDLGVLQLRRKEYVSALDAFLRGGHWKDAAYVAERVLATDELQTYIAAHKNDPGLTGFLKEKGPYDTTPPLSAYEDLRFLLARRLSRIGQLQKARNFYSPTLQVFRWNRGQKETYLLLDLFDEFVEALRAGRDNTRPAKECATDLLRAAKLARLYGMELSGTECAPDWYHLGEGSFCFPETPRLQSSWATDDEKQRAEKHASSPLKRFHYRYFAAELRWECAELLPDNDPITARVLWAAGRDMAGRDPIYADRFYKALVTRCRKLPIAQEADKLRWFPKEFPEE